MGRLPGARGVAAALPLIALALLPGGCGRAPAGPAGSAGTGAPAAARGTASDGVRFTRVTEEAGIRFRYENGATGKKYFPEVMGGGLALADFSGDGKPDLFLVNGGRLPGVSGGPASAAYYRNRGDGTFEDATAAAGLKTTGYGIGCCAADYDGDGWLDLYVTCVGGNLLFRNRGDGTFQDVTARAGVRVGGFSTGAAFGDYDNDGDLDLHVCRYVEWSVSTNIVCTDLDGPRRVPVYCRPTVYPPSDNVLLRNNGDGTFADVSVASGIRVTPGRSLGCVWTDVDEDGDQDLYVANDMSANHLFINQGGGRFKEEALLRGVATGESGEAQASMGVAATDLSGDGLVDLAVTNFSGEYLAYYRNQGDGYFEDVSALSGVAAASSALVGFGISTGDFNLDGWPDMFVGNGHVTEAAERFYPGTTFAQPNYCLLNNGTQFRAAAEPGAGVTQARISRGVAAADLDGDGDLDLVVQNQEEAPDVLRNDSAAAHWLRVRLSGDRKNRFGVGARVAVTAGGRTQVQEVRSGASYCGQEDLRLTFGLGSAERVEAVRVRWPSGKTQEVPSPAVDRELRITDSESP